MNQAVSGPILTTDGIPLKVRLQKAEDARNQADTMLHTAEKSLKERGDKISDAEKKAIKTASANLRNALKGTDTEEIKKKTQELVQAILFNIANPSTSFLPSYF